MKKMNITIYGREFNLPIEFDLLDDEKETSNQLEAVKKFKGLKKIDDSLKELVKYCYKKNPDEFNYKDGDNIFKYVMPKYIYVPRNNNSRVIAIMCNYKFDQDNGIAIVYKNEKYNNVVNQSVVL